MERRDGRGQGDDYLIYIKKLSPPPPLSQTGLLYSSESLLPKNEFTTRGLHCQNCTPSVKSELAHANPTPTTNGDSF
jgi:hypothetical protein